MVVAETSAEEGHAWFGVLQESTRGLSTTGTVEVMWLHTTEDLDRFAQGGVADDEPKDLVCREEVAGTANNSWLFDRMDCTEVPRTHHPQP